jgi:hypothetical protein
MVTSYPRPIFDPFFVYTNVIHKIELTCAEASKRRKKIA